MCVRERGGGGVEVHATNDKMCIFERMSNTKCR